MPPVSDMDIIDREEPRQISLYLHSPRTFSTTDLRSVRPTRFLRITRFRLLAPQITPAFRSLRIFVAS